MQSIGHDQYIAAAIAGSDEAWGGIVELNAEPMWRRAVTAGLTSAEAAQVCELVWLRLTQRLHTFTSLADVSRWLESQVEREATGTIKQRAGRRRQAGVPDNVVRLAPGFAPAPRTDASQASEQGVRHPVSGRQLISSSRRPGDPSPARF